METIRVYEFARMCGKPAKELVSELQQAGFDVKSHMSVLSEKELEFLHKKHLTTVQQPMEKQQEKRTQQKMEKVEEPKKIQAENKRQAPHQQKNLLRQKSQN